MENQIIIKAEFQSKGRWLKVNIPTYQSNAIAFVSSVEGELLKKVMLEEGNNAIDISHITNQSINVKIETANEVVLKKINLVYH